MQVRAFEGYIPLTWPLGAIISDSSIRIQMCSRQVVFLSINIVLDKQKFSA